jgi:hypothetical protein
MSKILLLLLVPFCLAQAQPEWVTRPPHGYLNDYFVGQGSSLKSKSEAAERAFASAIMSINQSRQITVQSSEHYKSFSTERSAGTFDSLQIVTKAARELNISGESQTIRGLRTVETYFEKDGDVFEAWVLVSMPKEHPVSPPSPFDPVWRSMLVPGWGQLYNGETFKGFSFMTIAVAGVTSGIICSALSNNSYSQALASRTQARRDYFNNLSNLQSTVSTVSFISAGVVYAWSLVDAIVVKPGNLYVDLSPEKKGVTVNLALSF